MELYGLTRILMISRFVCKMSVFKGNFICGMKMLMSLYADILCY